MRLIQRYCFLIILIHKIFGLVEIQDTYDIFKDTLGQGGHGLVRRGRNKETGKEVAIKTETSDLPLLLLERYFYDRLGRHTGIPIIYHFGIYNYRIALVMERFGLSLEDLLQKSKKGYFSHRTVALLGKQMIRRIEYVHSRGLVYIDIKPENFAVGLAHLQHLVYIFDFGLCIFYINENTGKHIKPGNKEGRFRRGPIQFISINLHTKFPPSRRDDMEALAHLLTFFSRGNLPWDDEIRNDPRTIETLSSVYCDKKKSTPISELLQSEYGNLPSEFGTLLEYARNLTFEQEPDYDYCDKLMDDVLTYRGFSDDPDFDWSENNLGANSKTVVYTSLNKDIELSADKAEARFKADMDSVAPYADLKKLQKLMTEANARVNPYLVTEVAKKKAASTARVAGNSGAPVAAKSKATQKSAKPKSKRNKKLFGCGSRK